MVMCFGLDLIITPLQSLVITTITTVHNKWLPKTRSILTGLRLAPFCSELRLTSFESVLLYDWRLTANQFVLATGPLRLTTSNFMFQLTLAVIVLMQHPHWREGGSVVYNCCRSSPAQPFSGPNSAALMIIFPCLRFKAPPTWRDRSPYLYPPGKGCPGYTSRHWFPFSMSPTTRMATVEVFDLASIQDDSFWSERPFI
jgi:hypothetical protein